MVVDQSINLLGRILPAADWNTDQSANQPPKVVEQIHCVPIVYGNSICLNYQIPYHTAHISTSLVYPPKIQWRQTFSPFLLESCRS